jgi:hypothetical protein
LQINALQIWPLLKESFGFASMLFSRFRWSGITWDVVLCTHLCNLLLKLYSCCIISGHDVRQNKLFSYIIYCMHRSLYGRGLTKFTCHVDLFDFIKATIKYIFL